MNATTTEVDEVLAESEHYERDLEPEEETPPNDLCEACGHYAETPGSMCHDCPVWTQ